MWIKGEVFVQEVNFVSALIGPVTLQGGLFYEVTPEGVLYAVQLFNQLYFFGQPRVYPQTPITLLQIGGQSDMSKNSYAAYLEGDWKITSTIANGRTLQLGEAEIRDRESLRNDW